MSAPQGPRATRSGSRGRGSSRGGPHSKVPKNGEEDRSVGQRSPSNAQTGNGPKRQLQPRANPNQILNKSWRSPSPVTSAILSHAGKISNSSGTDWRNPAKQDSGTYKKRMSELYQTLKDKRERERKSAIKNGFLADPDKPTSLANAITPVGTCQDMCPEFERVERIVQLMVDGSEKTLKDSGEKVPCENSMVKRFRRSAAGYDEQLPSDIRPPTVLQKSLDYLFDGVIGGPEPLATVHKFVWDRTRGIRNDFSIQQVTKTEDLRIAISCFERIARFHILCLHQLSQSDRDNGEFDHHQEREQLNNTLLSLMYYYDDSRYKLTSPNEAEFRAYCIIFEIQDQRPDLEDRAQNWPRSILKDQRVQTALKLYAAAGNTSDEQGPLRPRTQFTIAQANTGGFWSLIQSNSVPYVMACVAEIYFNLIRNTALDAIWRAYKAKRVGPTKMEDWVLRDLTIAFGFDNEEQTWTFCEEHELGILEKENGDAYIDLASVAGGDLQDRNPRRKQIFSRSLVESKRLCRTLPAIINGLSASQAQVQGLVEDLSDAETGSIANSESLFLNGDSDEGQNDSRVRSGSPKGKQGNQDRDAANLDATAQSFRPQGTFGLPSANPFKRKTETQGTFGSPSITAFQPKIAAQGTFGVPSTTQLQSNTTFGQPAPALPTLTGVTSKSIAGSLFQATPQSSSEKKEPEFNFYAAAGSTKQQEDTTNATPSAIKEPSKHDIFAQNNAYSTANTENGSKASPFGGSSEMKPSIFGEPSALSQANTSSKVKSIFVRPSTSPPTASGFSFATPPLSESSSTKIPVKEDKNIQGTERIKGSAGISAGISAGMSASPQAFSFGTSPFPKPSGTAPSADVAQSVSMNAPQNPASTRPESVPSQPLSTKPSTPFSPHPSIPPLAATYTSLNSLTKPAWNNTATNSDPIPPPNSFSLPPKAEPLTSQPLEASKALDSGTFIPQNRPTSLISPETGFASPQTVSTSPAAKSSYSGLDKNVSSAIFNLTATPKATQPNIFPSGASEIFSQEALSNPTRTDRTVTLDKLSNALMLDDGGLVQQFIEFTVGPIIESSIAQVKDERSWEEARKCRAMLLSRRYFKRWQTIAWNNGLMRRGRDRRRRFTRSLQNSARNLTRKQHQSNASLHQLQAPESPSAQLEAASMVPPPPKPLQKRHSLPAGLMDDGRHIVPEQESKKRKLNEADLSDGPVTPQPLKSHHKRSNTLGDSFLSAPPHRISRMPHKPRVDLSKLVDGSLLSETILKQARRLAPGVKSDTTRTDYFRLKALGIDPDTPIVPSTRKRPREEVQVNRVNKNTRVAGDTSSPVARPSSSHPTTHQPPSSASSAKTTSIDEEAEALFTQLRAAREAMAESESWFRSERESYERSFTPQTSASPPNPNRETPAQKRLRELRDRVPTPSRTEMRLRGMGDKALLPKGFWDGEGMGRSLYGNEAVRSQPEPPNHPRRMVNGSTPFAAIQGYGHLVAIVNGQLGGGDREEAEDVMKQGASADDAIEL